MLLLLFGEQEPPTCLIAQTGSPEKLQLGAEKQQQLKDPDRQQGDAFTKQLGVSQLRIFPLPGASVLEVGSVGSSVWGWIAMPL